MRSRAAPDVAKVKIQDAAPPAGGKSRDPDFCGSGFAVSNLADLSESLIKKPNVLPLGDGIELSDLAVAGSTFKCLP
jgi:hypothetical protein